MDSALSRTMNVPWEESMGGKGIKSSGFLMPAPMTQSGGTSHSRRIDGYHQTVP